MTTQDSKPNDGSPPLGSIQIKPGKKIGRFIYIATIPIECTDGETTGAFHLHCVSCGQDVIKQTLYAGPDSAELNACDSCRSRERVRAKANALRINFYRLESSMKEWEQELQRERDERIAQLHRERAKRSALRQQEHVMKAAWQGIRITEQPEVLS